MNVKNLKKVVRIDKKIIFRKLKSKFLNLFIDKFYRFRDFNISTFSYDYIAYFKLDTSKFDFLELLDLNINLELLNEYTDYCLNHRHKILSNQVVSINSNSNYNQIQSKFPKKIIPFTTKCYNFITDDYNRIDWQTDFNSNFNWKFDWYKNINYGNNAKSDIKVPWELGRLQHLPWLAIQYVNSEEVKFKNEIRNQLFDFMSSNPPNFGVQWMTSMDIGIRLINIIFTLSILNNNTDFFNDSEFELLESYLFDHYLHIKNNLEFSEGMRGNHYLSNLCSVVIYLCLIEEKDSSDNLINRYVNLIESELNFQFNEDGTNFEGSTRYHIFTNQMLITADLILQNSNRKSLNKDKIDKICSFSFELLQFITPPQLGDNDSGFFWKILNSESETFSSLKNLIAKNYNPKVSSNYQDFGYIREKYNNIDLIFKCGKLGQMGKGGHNHNDNLSYELYVNNEPFVVDSGTFCYTSNFTKRNNYRMTKAHNVLTIGEHEQNEFGLTTNDDMFWLNTDHSQPQLIKYDKNRINGSIQYCGKLYSRNIEFNENIIEITDNIETDLEKIVRIHLHPQIKIESVENGVYKLWKNENYIFLDTKHFKSEISEYNYSESYGVETISKVIFIYSNQISIQHKYRASLES